MQQQIKKPKPAAVATTEAKALDSPQIADTIKKIDAVKKLTESEKILDEILAKEAEEQRAAELKQQDMDAKKQQTRHICSVCWREGCGIGPMVER